MMPRIKLLQRVGLASQPLVLAWRQRQVGGAFGRAVFDLDQHQRLVTLEEQVGLRQRAGRPPGGQISAQDVGSEGGGFGYFALEVVVRVRGVA